MSAETPTAAEVLRAHWIDLWGSLDAAVTDENGVVVMSLCACGARLDNDGQDDGSWPAMAQHQADMLAAARLLVTAEQVEVSAWPTTDEVRAAFGRPATSPARARLAFDRWLAEHDAQVLRDAADALHAEFDRDRARSIGFGDPHDLATDIIDALNARADRIAGGGES